MSSTTSFRSLNIIIVGGGIAGLAAAGYLREQHNVTVNSSLDLASIIYVIPPILGSREISTQI